MATPICDEIASRVRSHPRLVIAEDYELCIQRERALGTTHRNGEIAKESSDESLWVSFRVLHRKRPGVAIARTSDSASLAKLVDDALESAERASVDPWFRFPIWRRTRGLMAESTAVPELERVPSPLFSRIENIPAALEESYETQVVETLLLRKAEKLELRHHRKTDRLRFSLVYETRGGFRQIREERALSRPLRERENWLEAMLRRADRYSEGVVFAGNESAQVIMSPVVVCALLSRITPWFLGDNAQAHRSPLSDLVEQQIFSEAISLVDDGTLADSPSSMPFDLEGALTQETCLVENGRLRRFLYDTYHATRENRVSTGNFLRRFGSATPRLDNGTTYCLPSSNTTADLMARMGQGYLLETVESVEPGGGDFQSRVLVTASGWRVEEGRRMVPVLGISLSLDLLKFWQDALAVGDDLEFFDRHGAPSILFGKIPLGM